MKKLLAQLLSLSMVMGLLAVPTFAESGFDNLNNEAGELVIGFLGGSITVADGDSNQYGFNRYATRVTEWFQEQYPEKTVTQVNAGIGGTGSDLGKYRVMTDIGAYAPDVVFVEYAVNDANISELYSETVRSNMETIVRNLQSLPKVPVIVFLYSMHDNSYSNIRYTSIPDHQDVADYYGIESINFYEYMSDLVQKGEFVWAKGQSGTLTNDNIHPNALGHEQYGNYIISQLESRDILHENNVGLSRKFMFTTKDARDIKFADADNIAMTGTWENGTAGQADNKYEAIQATAEGDTVSFTYESTGNDTLGVTLIGGTGTWVLDEDTENELTGELSGASNDLPIVKKFVEGLSAGTHTVKITNTNGLKLGRIIADGGVEVNAASTAPNGDHIPASMPENRIIGCQVPNFHRDTNDTQISYSEYTGDYTSNHSYTVRKITALSDLTAGGFWGCHGIYIERATAELNKGILYDNYTATAGTYVFKAKVRAIAGNPTVGATTVKSYVPTYDDVYGNVGFTPSAEWEDYKATLSPKDDGFSVQFGILNATSSDVLGFDVGDGVYYAPEVAYDVAVEVADENKAIAQGTTKNLKAAVVNQIGIPAHTATQEFTWEVVDENGDAVEGITLTPADDSSKATIDIGVDVELGTYYVKAVATAYDWQKTLPIVVEESSDPFVRDHVPGAMPENRYIAEKGEVWASSRIMGDGVAYTGTRWINGLDWSANKIYTTQDIESVLSYYGMSGVYVNTAAVVSTGIPVTNVPVEEYKAGDHYVFSFAARNANADIPVQLRVGVWNGTYSGAAKDYIPVQEYPNGIVDLPQTGEWVTVKTTLPERSTPADGVAPSIRMGFPVGTVKDAAIELNICVEDVSETYYAKEVPHSITLEGVDGNSVITGNDATFKAELLNQLGLTGYLDQDAVTFTVGDAKGNEIEGLTVTADGNVATVSAKDSVEAGEYYLRANYAIDETTTWRKTIAIEVVSAIANTTDFVQPQMPENKVIAKPSSFWFSARTTSTQVDTTSHDWVNGVGYSYDKFTAKEDITTVSSSFGSAGAYLGGALSGSSNAIDLEAADYKVGDHYVLSFAARNANPELPAQLRMGVWNGTYSGAAKDYIPVQEYPNGIIDLPQTGEWVNIKVTLAERGTPADGQVPSIRYGFPVGTVAGAAMDLNINVAGVPEVYYAKEVPYTFSVTANAQSVEQGKSIELDATLLNQLDLTGYLSQEFTWVAITDDRTELLDGFTFEANAEDASKTTLTVSEDVAPGEYLIVAQNAEEGVAKHYTLTVVEATEPVVPVEFAVTGVEIADDTVTVSFEGIPEGGKNVVLYVAKYLGGAFNGAEVKPITLTGENATESKPQSFTKAEGETVKAFIWNPDMTAVLETPATN